MEKKLEDFLLRLKRGPSFLFLGQDYLRLETGQDLFLHEVIRKFGKSGDERPSYDLILDGNASKQVEPAVAWMQQRCDRFSIPDYLKTIGAYNWSGVFSSVIDSIWLKAFKTGWREIYPIYEERVNPADPRNRIRLHCTFLFGSVSRVDEPERPPLTRMEFIKRKQIAVGLARRIPAYVTPLGVLVIEGYAGQRDWLKPEDLYPIIDQFTAGQVHLFNASNEIVENTLFKNLITQGKLIAHDESLAKVLSIAQEEGHVQLGQRPQSANFGRRVRIKRDSMEVPISLWNQVSRSALILDDLATIAPPPLSLEQRYQEFKNFLWHSGSSPIWSGFTLGFSFEREYETQLRSIVVENLISKEPYSEPVILHGQTGTGKTIALSALAYRLYMNQGIPVLYIDRKPQKPIASDMDAFCKWAEDVGAPSTLIVWDGMLDPSQYYELLRGLLSRGRKAVLVGSCYKLDERERVGLTAVQAPAALTDNELVAFRAFLDKIDSGLSKILESSKKKQDETFLVALYRLLPPSRAGIRSGLIREVEFAESEIMKRAREKSIAPQSSTISYALWKAGLITEQHILSLEKITIGDESVSQPETLTGLVMIPGKFGLKVPFDLLLRAAGASDIDLFLKILDVDLFRWSEDSLGNIYVAARNPLEAKLIVQSRFGGPMSEIALMSNLLIETTSNLDGGEAIEIPFAVELVRNLGPKSSDASYYSPYFLELAKTLSQLREMRGIINPRLMLQESTLLREAAVKQVRPENEMHELLERAESIVRTSLVMVEKQARSAKFRSLLLVELGTILGSRATQQLKRAETKSTGADTFEKARTELIRARSLDPDNYYPIDVLFWTTRDLINAKVLGPTEEAEAKADLLHAFTMAEVEDLSMSERERYQGRRLELGGLLAEREIEDAAFDALAKLGSKAGYYLKARGIAGDLAMNSPVNKEQLDRYTSALNYLQSKRDQIIKDARCMHLLLRLWWLVNTGRPLFFGERQTVPFTPELWIALKKIILELKACDETQSPPSISYLQGYTEFHLGDLNSAFDVFRSLEQEAEFVYGRRRIIRSYLASTENGMPKKFHGGVSRLMHDNSKGEVFVEEIRRSITFFPRDFGRPDIRRSEPLPEFHIAFNFLGPIADPPTFHRELLHK